MTLTAGGPDEPCWTSGDGAVKVFSGDCLDVMARMPAACADAVVTDPPYGLSFGDSDWDTFGGPAAFGEWCTRWAAGCLRVLKPGGYLLAFGGTRLWHRLAAGIEDAGGEVRDTIMWVYGTGFPKSVNVAKAVDRALGAAPAPPAPGGGYVPATPEAARFLGYGTGLKPAWEPVIVARRPLDGTVAANALAHGTGGLNIDGCRVPAGGPRPTRIRDSSAPRRPRTGHEVYGKGFGDTIGEPVFTTQGRWPPNLVLGHAEGCRPPGRADDPGRPAPDWDCTDGCPAAGIDHQAAALGTAPAARYFPVMIYQPKAPPSERPILTRTAMRLRGDLTDGELAYVLAEIRKAGIDAA